MNEKQLNSKEIPAKIFKEIRIKAGLTQAQLANFFGLSSQTRISEYENGTRNPSAGIKKLYQLIKEKKIKPA